MNDNLPPDFEARWRARFERLGQKFDTEADIAGWSENGLATRLRLFRRCMGSVSGRWLDAGCGAGSYVRALMEAGAGEVVAVDYSGPSLVKARALTSGGSAWWVQADVRGLPLAEESVDGALCFGVSQALSESDSMARELARVVRPGGTVWVDGLNAGSLQHRVSRWRRRSEAGPARLRVESPPHLAETLARAGLAPTRVVWVPIAPGALRSLQPVFDQVGAVQLGRLGAVLSHGFMLEAAKVTVPASS